MRKNLKLSLLFFIISTILFMSVKILINRNAVKDRQTISECVSGNTGNEGSDCHFWFAGKCYMGKVKDGECYYEHHGKGLVMIVMGLLSLGVSIGFLLSELILGKKEYEVYGGDFCW
jgi:hypothetical protein